MSHKKAGGSTSNLRDSKGQRLGVKIFGGQKAKAGSIIVRQRGTRYFAGKGVKRSHDDTMFALVAGIVEFKKKAKLGYDNKLKKRVEVNVRTA
jgi:large subunit ribosomal protein L27